MKAIKRPDQYLRLRGDIWHYFRRVELEAMRAAPNGFPDYRDRSYLLSASLTKAFKARELFPTKEHRVYSFRHSFENRMLEAGLDSGLRCTLMGHRNPRPECGDGGSLTYRRDELLKSPTLSATGYCWHRLRHNERRRR